jgi:hypothetical protein
MALTGMYKLFSATRAPLQYLDIKEAFKKVGIYLQQIETASQFWPQKQGL